MKFKHRDIQLVRCEECRNPIYRHMFYCPELKEPMLTETQQREIIRIATENAHDISNANIGEPFGVSGERVRQIVKAAGLVKARKLGAEHECQKPKCKRRFRGVRDYSGHKAQFCHLHRRKGVRGKQ